MAQQLTLADAHIRSIEAVFDSGNMECIVSIQAPITRQLLELLRAEYLVGNSGNEKAISYDYKLSDVRLDMVPVAGMDRKRLRFDCLAADAFKIVRRSKPSGSVTTEVHFRCLAKASALTLLDYVLNVGGPDGVITLEPLQGELFDVVAPATPAEKPKLKKSMDGGSTRIQ